MFLSVKRQEKKRQCKVVAFETIVHVTHFCQLGTGGLDYKNKIKITWDFLAAARPVGPSSF